MCAFLASNESSMAFTLPSCRILEFVDQLLVRNVHKNKLSSRMDKIKWCITGSEVCYLFELASLRRVQTTLEKFRHAALSRRFGLP